MRVAAVLIVSVLVLRGTAAALPTDAWVVINEIHYHGADDSLEGEFLELGNRGAEPVDLGGWRLEDAVEFTFPAGTVIPPEGFLVVAANVDVIAARHGITSVVGNYSGSLSNQGETVTLRNASGHLISSVTYDDQAPWPDEPDGLGPSLERIHPMRDEVDHDSWRASVLVGGTPGARNSVYAEDAPGMSIDFIPCGGTWRFFRGTGEPPGEPLEWAGLGFEDAGWEEDCAGFGYGDGDDCTVLDDMRWNYTTVYIRRAFSVADPSRIERLSLLIDYDDGFVAYVNGKEVLRVNARSEADYPRDEAIPHDETAPGSHEQNGGDVIPFEDALPLLLVGRNVLAIQGFNVGDDSSDFSLNPCLLAVEKRERVEPMEPAPRDAAVNEIFFGGAGAPGWIEIYNRGGREIDLSGMMVTVVGRLPFPDRSLAIPAGTTLEKGGFLVIDGSSLGGRLDRDLPVVVITTADGRLVDALNPRTTDGERSSGCYPDGSGERYVLQGPTPGAPNVLGLRDEIVLNEIHYHPPEGEDGTEFIELHNRSDHVVDLTGWHFTKGIDFLFESGPVVPPGGYVVLAADPGSVEAAYGLTDVLGPWVGKLSRDGETVLLRDEVRNPADEVRYADEGLWSEEADGLGPSVELIHPSIDNLLGPAWAPSDGRPTPGAANSRWTADPPPCLTDVRHRPLVPSSGEPVTVTVRVSHDRPLVALTLYWRPDGIQDEPSSSAMVDDGLADDGVAGNGVWGATIAAAPHGTIMTFWITADGEGGHQVTVPPSVGTRQYLYQVSDVPHPENRAIFRIVMRDDDLETLSSRSIWSDDLLDCTLIAEGEVYYNRGIRFRGRSSRQVPRKSYRIQLDHDRDLHGTKRLNLNAYDVFKQWAGADFFRRAEALAPTARFRNLVVNGRFDGLYLWVDAVDEEFLKRVFPGEDRMGNLYRGEQQANLDYRGQDPDPYLPHYLKRNNNEDQSYEDIIRLCEVFDPATTPARDFPDRIEKAIDVAQWARYFAIFAMLGSTEGAIQLDRGDDYYIYHRVSDGRWVILPWDLDEIFERTNEPLFRSDVEAIRRFLTHRLHAWRYYRDIEDFLDHVLDPAIQEARLDTLVHLFDPGTVQSLKNYIAPRRNYLGPRISRDLGLDVQDGTAVCIDGQDGIGAGPDHAIIIGPVPVSRTVAVTVNGEPAIYSPVSGRYATSIDLGWRVTPVSVVAWNIAGMPVARRDANILRAPGFVEIAGEVPPDQSLSPGTPYRVTGDLTVPLGVTFEIEPGTEIYIDPGVSLTVMGTLLAEGTEGGRITFSPLHCAEPWGGIAIVGPDAVGRIRTADLRLANRHRDHPGALAVFEGRLEVGDSRFTDMGRVIDASGGATLVVENCRMERIQGGIHGSGSRASVTSTVFLEIAAGGHAIEIEGETAEPSSVAGCVISGGDGTGIRLAGSSASVSDSILARLLGSGVVLEGPSHPMIERTLIHASGQAGIALLDGVSASISHVTVHGCRSGILAAEGAPGRGVGGAVVDSSIIWGSQDDVAGPREALEVDHSNVGGGEVPPGIGNIAGDPIFEDPSSGDFRLGAGSPCIGTGRDGADMGALPGGEAMFVRGDATGDRVVTIEDAVRIVYHVFLGASLPCLDAADSNDSGRITVADGIQVLKFLFGRGEAPSSPYPYPGTDPTDDSLGCGP